MRVYYSLLLLLIFIALVSCKSGGSSGPSNSGNNVVSKDIGSDGGTLVSDDGNLTLTFPEGALSETETITIGKLDEADLGSEFGDLIDSLGLGGAYELGPGGLEFNTPVTVSLSAGQTNELNDTTLQVRLDRLMFTSTNGQTEALGDLSIEPEGSPSDTTNNDLVLTGELSHFSTVTISDSDETGFLKATATGVPDAVEYGREVEVNVRADVKLTVEGATFRDYDDGLFNFVPAEIGNEAVAMNEVEPESPVKNFELNPVYVCEEGENEHGFFLSRVKTQSSENQGVVGRSELSVTFEKALKCVDDTNFTLIAQKDGEGNGTITGISTFTGTEFINCPEDCKQDSTSIKHDGGFDGGFNTLELEATPDNQSIFTGWSGNHGGGDGCGESNAGGGTCVVEVDKDRTVTATFEPELAEGTPMITGFTGTQTSQTAVEFLLEINFSGNSNNLEADINYGDGTTEKVEEFEQEGETHTAIMNHDYEGTGSVTPQATATNSETGESDSDSFGIGEVEITVQKDGDGEGTVFGVTSWLGNRNELISCGPGCAMESEQFHTSSIPGFNIPFTLEPRPEDGSVFAGWNGNLGSGSDGCTGDGDSDNCTVPVNGDRTITATFEKEPSGSCDMEYFTSDIDGDNPAIVGEELQITPVIQNSCSQDVETSQSSLMVDNGEVVDITCNGDDSVFDDLLPAEEISEAPCTGIEAGQVRDGATFIVVPDETGSLNMDVEVGSEKQDPNPQNNTGEVSVEIEEEPANSDLGLTIADTPSEALEAGEEFELTYVLFSNGPDIATNVQVDVSVSNGGTITEGSSRSDIECGETGNSELTCSTESVEEGFSKSNRVDVVAPGSGGSFTVRVEASSSETDDPNGANNVSEAELEVKQPNEADLAIGFGSEVDTFIAPGETGSASVNVTNFGPDAPTQAGFVLRFVDGVITGVSDDTRINCTNPPDEEVGCNIEGEAENLQTNDVIMLDIEYTSDIEGTHNLEAEISASSSDPVESNNSDLREVDVQQPDDATELTTGLFDIIDQVEGLYALANNSSSSKTRFGIAYQNRVEDTHFGDLNGKLPVVFSGSFGFIVKDLLTNEILSEQFASAGAPAFGVIGLTETPRGPDSPATFVLFGKTGVGFYSANGSGGTQSGNQPPVFDAFPAGGNAESSYGLYVNTSIRYIEIEEGDTRHLPRSLFDELAPNADDFDGQVVSAWMPDDGTPNDTSPIVLDRDTDPNNSTESGLYFLPRGDADNRPVPERLADVGLDARKVRCQNLDSGNFLCAVTVFGDDQVALFVWDGGTTLNSTGTINVGDGPVDLQLRELPDGNFGLVTTGFNDNTVTVTELSNTGSVLSNNTQAAPSGCQSPAHAIFVRDSTSLKVVGTCYDSDNYFIMESGL